ncbi:unnamed protein product [Closterium sp. Naga37s-1]|nr:unnamed protein product [Closterium sp. Naga37s-1]
MESFKRVKLGTNEFAYSQPAFFGVPSLHCNNISKPISTFGDKKAPASAIFADAVAPQAQTFSRDVQRPVAGDGCDSATTRRTCHFDRVPNELVAEIARCVFAKAQSAADVAGMLVTCRRFSSVCHPAASWSLRASAAIEMLLPADAARWTAAAQRLLLSAAAEGNLEAIYVVGMISFYCLNNHWAGAKLLAQAAEAGHGAAMYSLAIINFHGSGGAADDANPEAPSDRVLLEQGDDSLDICRVVNGMWQSSSGAWGQAAPDAVVTAMLQHADAGLTTFDMADIYGPAESYYGAMIDRLRRERGEEAAFGVQGLTKFVPRPDRMTRDVVEVAINRSRTRMQVKTIDLLQFHWWDYANPGYLDALKHLTDLKEEGKIKAIGLTNFDTTRLQVILENGIPIVSNQVQHSLVDMRPQQQMAQLCALTGVQLITYGTVMGGLLSEKYLHAKEHNSMFGPRLATPSLNKYKQMVDAWGGWALFQELLRECETVAKKHGVTIAAVAVRSTLDQPSVAASMVGVRLGLQQHIADNKVIFGLKLDDEDRARITSVTSRGRDLLAVIGDCGDEYR